MNRIKENIPLKILVSILLSIALCFGVISGIAVYVALMNDYYTPGGKTALKNNILEGICLDYNSMSYQWYEDILHGEGENEYYELYFDEENTNYFFTIEPLYEADREKYVTLSNYSCNDYQYKGEHIDNTVVYYDTNTFETTVVLAEIPNDKLKVTQYYSDGDTDSDEVTYILKDNGNLLSDKEEYYDYELLYTDTLLKEDSIVITFYYDGCEVSYKMNVSDIEGYNEFVDSLETEYDYYGLTNAYYDIDEQKLYVEYEISEEIWLKQTHYVKTDLEACDNFYYSSQLNYMYPAMQFALPVFIISCILIIVLFTYVCVVAGHRKDGDGKELIRFHRIPYDVLLAIYFVVICTLLSCCFNIYFRDYVKRIIVYGALMLPIVILFPPMVYTTAARLKNGSIFKNTLLYRIIRFLVRGICRCAKIMRNNINLYWKWLGGYAVISFIEIIMCLSAYDFGFTVGFWVIEKICIAALLIAAVTNMNKLKLGGEMLADGRTDYEIATEDMLWEFKKHGENLNHIKDGIQFAVEERMRSEKMKTELITNVSHDIKTPLTSIINYVDLLSKEELDNDNATEYIEVLKRQSEKLKKLILDLIDASKASTGNMPVEICDVDVKVLLEQSLGEFADKLSEKNLKPVVNFNTEDTVVKADGKHLWRVIDNLISNISKYAQENTRVYIEVDRYILKSDTVNNTCALRVSFKNISKDELNVSGDELMERFVRGDESRNTDGNGLGLSIAKSLMNIQNGDLKIVIDGDLFKVELFI